MVKLLEELMRRKTELCDPLPSPAERKALRVRLGLTQAELARAIGVHPETLGRWERGDGLPGKEEAATYRQALELLQEHS